jgi:hypothetical protein
MSGTNQDVAEYASQFAMLHDEAIAAEANAKLGQQDRLKRCGVPVNVVKHNNAVGWMTTVLPVQLRDQHRWKVEIGQQLMFQEAGIYKRMPPRPIKTTTTYGLPTTGGWTSLGSLRYCKTSRISQLDMWTTRLIFSCTTERRFSLDKIDARTILDINTRLSTQETQWEVDQSTVSVCMDAGQGSHPDCLGKIALVGAKETWRSPDLER